MVNQELFKRNQELIKKRLEWQLEISLEKGRFSIDKELSGLFNILIKPLVKKFYEQVARKSMEEGSRKQIDVTLAASIEVAMRIDDDVDNNIQKSIDDVANKYFLKYLVGDQTSRQLKKRHKNYGWVLENTKKVFKNQIEPLIKLLRCESEHNLSGEKITTYDDLAVATFKEREITRKALTNSLKLMDEGLKKIEQDPSILDLPVGRNILLKILRTGFQETWAELEAEIDALEFS
jgi:hypothetical protein